MFCDDRKIFKNINNYVKKYDLYCFNISPLHRLRNLLRALPAEMCRMDLYVERLKQKTEN
jgi:hypothetical protein